MWLGWGRFYKVVQAPLSPSPTAAKNQMLLTHTSEPSEENTHNPHYSAIVLGREKVKRPPRRHQHVVQVVPSEKTQGGVHIPVDESQEGPGKNHRGEVYGGGGHEGKTPAKNPHTGPKDEEGVLGEEGYLLPRVPGREGEGENVKTPSVGGSQGKHGSKHSGKVDFKQCVCAGGRGHEGEDHEHKVGEMARLQEIHYLRATNAVNVEFEVHRHDSTDPREQVAQAIQSNQSLSPDARASGSIHSIL